MPWTPSASTKFASQFDSTSEPLRPRWAGQANPGAAVPALWSPRALQAMLPVSVNPALPAGKPDAVIGPAAPPCPASVLPFSLPPP